VKNSVTVLKSLAPLKLSFWGFKSKNLGQNSVTEFLALFICFQHFFLVMRPNFRLDRKNYNLHFKNILFNHSVSEATPNSKITGSFSASCSPSGYGGQECVRHQGKLFRTPQQQAGARHGEGGSRCLSPGAGRRGHYGGSSKFWGQRQSERCPQQPARWRQQVLVKEAQTQWQQWQ
jgi:hypothetical protein